ncbi:hypothetical protein CAPTEDRAFT_77625, partial [Capitella teleta]
SDESTITCGGEFFEVSCPVGSQLHLPILRWGRTADGSVCPHDDILSVECLSTEAPSIIRAVCEGEPKCNFEVSRHTLQDPCYNTYKYLNATHTC